MARQLTAAQKQLLRHPPIQTTWTCNRKQTTTKVVDGVPTIVEFACRGITSKGTACSYCNRPKTSKAIQLYPAYLDACSIAGIEPGTRWPVKTDEPETTDAPKRKHTRRKGA